MRTYFEDHKSHPWTNPHHPECEDPECTDDAPVCWKHAEDMCDECGSTGLHQTKENIPCPKCHGHGAVGYLVDGTPDPDYVWND